MYTTASFAGDKSPCSLGEDDQNQAFSVCEHGYGEANEERTIYSLTNDFVFKWIFGQQKHEKHCICLLNALLMLEGDNAIKSLTFLNPFNYKEYKPDKESIVDTRVKDAKGQLYNIEIQLFPDDSFVSRTTYYLAKLYSSQLKAGDRYGRLCKTTGLSLLGFNLFTTSTRIVEVFEFRNRHSDLTLEETMAIHYLDLTKFNEMKPAKLRTRFEKWLHILKFGDEYVKIKSGLAEELIQEEGVREVVDEMIKINSDNEKRQLMEAAERSRTCIDLMKTYAYQSGIEKGVEQTAITMLKKGLEIELICEFTGLTKQRILEIQHQT